MESSTAGCEHDEAGNVIDPLLGEIIPPERLIRVIEGTATYCFDLDVLYREYVLSGRLTNPYTRNPLPDWVQAKIKEYSQQRQVILRILYKEQLISEFSVDEVLRIGQVIVLAIESFREYLLPQQPRVSSRKLIANWDLHILSEGTLYAFDLFQELRTITRDGLTLELSPFENVVERLIALGKLYDYTRDSGPNWVPGALIDYYDVPKSYTGMAKSAEVSLGSRDITKEANQLDEDELVYQADQKNTVLVKQLVIIILFPSSLLEDLVKHLERQPGAEESDVIRVLLMTPEYDLRPGGFRSLVTPPIRFLYLEELAARHSSPTYFSDLLELVDVAQYTDLVQELRSLIGTKNQEQRIARQLAWTLGLISSRTWMVVLIHNSTDLQLLGDILDCPCVWSTILGIVPTDPEYLSLRPEILLRELADANLSLLPEALDLWGGSVDLQVLLHLNPTNLSLVQELHRRGVDLTFIDGQLTESVVLYVAQYGSLSPLLMLEFRTLLPTLIRLQPQPNQTANQLLTIVYERLLHEESSEFRADWEAVAAPDVLQQADDVDPEIFLELVRRGNFPGVIILGNKIAYGPDTLDQALELSEKVENGWGRMSEFLQSLRDVQS